MIRETKLIRLIAVLFLVQWMHLQGFLNPSFLLRTASRRNLCSEKRFIPPNNMQLHSRPFQIYATGNDALDDFLGPDDEDEYEEVEYEEESERSDDKRKKLDSYSIDSFNDGRVRTNQIVNNQIDSEESSSLPFEDEESDLDEYDDNFFRTWLSSDSDSFHSEEGRTESHDDDTTSMIPYDGDSNEEQDKPTDDGVIYDANGKVLQLSTRVNRLLQKLSIQPHRRQELQQKLLNQPHFRGEFIEFGERYLRWQAKNFEEFLDETFQDPELLSDHFKRLSTDAHYRKEYEFQVDNLDEQRVQLLQQEEETAKQLLPFINVLTEIRANETFQQELLEELQSNPTLATTYDENRKVFSQFAIKKLSKLHRWQEFFTELYEKNNTELQAMVSSRIEHDPIFAEHLERGYQEYLKFIELEEDAGLDLDDDDDNKEGVGIEDEEENDNDFDPEDLTGPTIVIPEGFLVRRYEVVEEDPSQSQKVIIQIPESTKYGTYSKLPDDGRLVISLQPYENPDDPNQNDFSEMMVIFPESCELQLIDSTVTLEDDDDWDPEDDNLVGIISIPSTMKVVDVPAHCMIGEIDSVLTPKGMRVVRTRPDSMDTLPGEIILHIPETTQIYPMVGTFPKSKLLIEARLDKKYPEYYLSQNITIRRLLPEEAENYPQGVLVVPPLTAVSTKAHELIDYNFKSRYLNHLPTELRAEISKQWDFEPKDEDEEDNDHQKSSDDFLEELTTGSNSRKESTDFQSDIRDASSWGADIDWPRTFEEIDALKDIPEHFPVYCLMYFIRENERNDLLQFEYDKHEQYARSFHKLIYHDIIRTKELVTSQYSIPEMEAVCHFFVGGENEWEATIDEVESFISQCPLKNSGKVERFKVIALHEIDGERGKVPSRFKEWTPNPEEELTEKEEMAYILRKYDADIPEELQSTLSM